MDKPYEQKLRLTSLLHHFPLRHVGHLAYIFAVLIYDVYISHSHWAQNASQIGLFGDAVLVWWFSSLSKRVDLGLIRGPYNLSP
jgi:hypothetical protein